MHQAIMMIISLQNGEWDCWDRAYSGREGLPQSSFRRLANAGYTLPCNPDPYAQDKGLTVLFAQVRNEWTSAASRGEGEG